jgi:hypothetical protein
MRQNLLMCIVAILVCIGLNSRAAVAQNRADQALELLRITLSCPPKPIIEEQLEPVNAKGTYRTFKTLIFTGSDTTFRLVVKTERRLHDRNANVVNAHTDRESYSAPFSAIAAIDIVGSDAANNPILALSCKADGCFSAGSESNSGSNEDTVEVPFCDADTATKAKVALDILRGTEQESIQPIPFKLSQKMAASGQNLGQAIDGSSGAECLRKCRANGRCKAFTVLHAAEYDVCQLKTSIGQLAQEDYTDTGVLERDEGATQLANIPNENQSSSRWMHNGSIVTLTADGAKREFHYFEPHKGLSFVGVKSGTLLFSGRRTGKTYSGTAYIFNKHCGPVAYEVAGRVAEDDHQVTMEGQAPIVDGNCTVISTKPGTLIFSYEGK